MADKSGESLPGLDCFKSLRLSIVMFDPSQMMTFATFKQLWIISRVFDNSDAF